MGRKTDSRAVRRIDRTLQRLHTRADFQPRAVYSNFINGQKGTGISWENCLST